MRLIANGEERAGAEGGAYSLALGVSESVRGSWGVAASAQKTSELGTFVFSKRKLQPALRELLQQ